jgi:hypothetical protein
VPVGQLTAEELDATKPADYCELTRNWGQKRCGREGNLMVMRMVGLANKWDNGQVFCLSNGNPGEVHDKVVHDTVSIGWVSTFNCRMH